MQNCGCGTEKYMRETESMIKWHEINSIYTYVSDILINRYSRICINITY